MHRRIMFCTVMATIVIFIALSGCTAPSGTATQTPVPTTVQPLPPATTAPVATSTMNATAPAVKTQTDVEKVILQKSGTISPKTYKTYDFKAMGDEFSKIGTKYRITLKADKPVLGYAVTTLQSDELEGSELIPHYVPQSEKIYWGMMNPYMVLENVTDAKSTFTVDKEAPYVYVVDGRFMDYDDKLRATTPFNYTISITKINNPEPTPLVANS